LFNRIVTPDAYASSRCSLEWENAATGFLRRQGESLNNIERILSDLEEQREAIERALSALREVADLVRSGAPAVAESSAPPRRKRSRLSAAGRRAISEATKRQWALKRAAERAAARKPPARAATRKATKKTAPKKKPAAKAAGG
jgi:hypothetical protein